MFYSNLANPLLLMKLISTESATLNSRASMPSRDSTGLKPSATPRTLSAVPRISVVATSGPMTDTLGTFSAVRHVLGLILLRRGQISY